MAKKTMKDLGYIFNEDGCLRRTDSVGRPSQYPYNFDVSCTYALCQQHYEELGEALTDHIYELLVKEEKLIKLPVPEGSSEEKGTFVFVSKDYDTKDKLLILIHGSGVVRAGQWARSIIINNNIHEGSQIPYIRKALEQDYGVLVMNPNDNSRNIDGEEKQISNSRDSNEHASYVWEKYVLPTKAKCIAIVAHSYGGVNTVTLANRFRDDFENRVKAIAFTDSVHASACPLNEDATECKVTQYMLQVGRNWIASSQPVDTPVRTQAGDITKVSAGHKKHEMTSHCSLDSIFKFLAEKCK